MARTVDVEDVSLVDESVFDREAHRSSSDDVRNRRAREAIGGVVFGDGLAAIEVLGNGERDRVVLEGLAEDVGITDGHEQAFWSPALVDDQFSHGLSLPVEQLLFGLPTEFVGAFGGCFGLVVPAETLQGAGFLLEEFGAPETQPEGVVEAIDGLIG